MLGGLALGLSFLLFGPAALGGPLQTAIITATAGAMLIGWRAGHGFDAMGDAALASVLGGFDTIAVLFAVGALLGTWAMSGTLLALGYYLLQVLTPEWLYLTSALITALIGFTIASAWTAASTVGICLVGIATQIGLDPAITAGAVISGAYFGDKLSPRSKKSRLTASLAGVSRRGARARSALDLAAVLRRSASSSSGGWASPRAAMRWRSSPASTTALDIRPVLLLPLAAVIALAAARGAPVHHHVHRRAGRCGRGGRGQARDRHRLRRQPGAGAGAGAAQGRLAGDGDRLRRRHRQRGARCLPQPRRHGLHAGHDLADHAPRSPSAA